MPCADRVQRRAPNPADTARTARFDWRLLCGAVNGQVKSYGAADLRLIGSGASSAEGSNPRGRKSTKSTVDSDSDGDGSHALGPVGESKDGAAADEQKARDRARSRFATEQGVDPKQRPPKEVRGATLAVLWRRRRFAPPRGAGRRRGRGARGCCLCTRVGRMHGRVPRRAVASDGDVPRKTT